MYVYHCCFELSAHQPGIYTVSGLYPFHRKILTEEAWDEFVAHLLEESRKTYYMPPNTKVFIHSLTYMGKDNDGQGD